MVYEAVYLDLLLLSTGGGGELGHHQHVRHSPASLQASSRLSHRPLQDPAVAERTPGKRDPVPARRQMSRTRIGQNKVSWFNSNGLFCVFSNSFYRSFVNFST